MATVADLIVQIGGDSSGLRKEIEATERQLKRSFGRDALGASEASLEILTGLTAGIGAFGVACIVAAADMERTVVSFTALLDSAEKAEEMVSQLEELSRKTGMEMPGLETASKKLMALGFVAEDVVPIIKTVSNATQVLGTGSAGMESIVAVLGKIQAQGKITSREMRTLTSENILAWPMLAQARGVSIEEATKRVKNGAIDSVTAINALMVGIVERYPDGANKMAATTIGAFNRIKTTTEGIMDEIGGQMSTALNIAPMLTKAANYLNDFYNLVKTCGVKEAIMELIPQRAIEMVFMFGGALVGAAVAAMVLFAGAIWGAIAPLIPFIALGAALGGVAYIIWAAWEPIKDMFWGVFDGIAGAARWGFGEVIIAALSGLRVIAEAMESIKSLLPSFMQGIAGNISGSIIRLSNEASEFANAGLNQMNKGFSKAGSRFIQTLEVCTAKTKELKSQVSEAFKAPELHTPDGSLAKPTAIGSSVIPKADTTWEKMQAEAKRVSEDINKQWVSTTKNQIEQLDIWKTAEDDKNKYISDEMTKQGKTYEDYEINKSKIQAVYDVRSQKILEDNSKKNRDIYQSITDGYLAMTQNSLSDSLRGYDKDVADQKAALVDKQKAIKDYFSKINDEYTSGTAEQKKTVIDSLKEAGIAYKQDATGKLNFDKEIAKQNNAVYKNYLNKKIENERSCTDIQKNLDEAYQIGSMLLLKKALTTEKALRMNQLAAEKKMMDVYQKSTLAAHSTIAGLISNVYEGAFSGLSTAISGLLTGTQTVSQAFVQLGSTMLKVVADYVAQWLAGQLMMAIFGETAQDTQAATSAAAGSAVALAWAPAAAAVSLASFGANAEPATAGIASTYGLSYALSIPKLADGGITTGPALAMIGEGRYQEAVVPLNKKAFEKIGLTGSGNGGGNSINLHINAIDGASFKKWLTNGGGKLIEKHLSGRVKQFAPVGV